MISSLQILHSDDVVAANLCFPRFWAAVEASSSTKAPKRRRLCEGESTSREGGGDREHKDENERERERAGVEELEA